MAEASQVSVASTPGLVSILIPCCGMQEYTKLCVASVLKHSRAPFELIFLDIGSLDGTADYLAGLKSGAPVRIETVRTPTDLGINVVCEQALAQARGDFLVLLNNDTVVTNGWLQQVIGLANLSPAMGLVGPMSNYAAVPQLVVTVPYRVSPRRANLAPGAVQERQDLIDVNAVERFAREFREQQKGKWMEVDRLGGFCLLLKREVLTRIGSLESWTDLSLFDTDILSAKARQVGYKLACCRDLFVHHFGTRTFAHGAPKAAPAPK
jgi:GT2 family glycosyltransferase